VREKQNLFAFPNEQANKRRSLLSSLPLTTPVPNPLTLLAIITKLKTPGSKFKNLVFHDPLLGSSFMSFIFNLLPGFLLFIRLVEVGVSDFLSGSKMQSRFHLLNSSLWQGGLGSLPDGRLFLRRHHHQGRQRETESHFVTTIPPRGGEKEASLPPIWLASPVKTV